LRSCNRAGCTNLFADVATTMKKGGRSMWTGQLPEERRRTVLWWRSAGPLVVVLVLVAVSLAACGGSPSNGVAGSGSTTTTSTAASSSAHGSTGATGLLAYSSCMRSHGVSNFPDPTSNGGIPKETAQQLGVSQSQVQAAQSDCTRLLPAGGTLSGTNNQTITVAQQQYYLKVASCMRSHGVTNFPEPSFFGGSVEFQGLGHLPGVHSPLFTHAFDICRKLIPAGLPYGSGSGG
jgi:hypothetical protein